jgi:hypothetical protein
MSALCRPNLGAIIPNLNTILWLSATVAEAAVIGLLIYRRVYRAFPIFFAYSIWTLIGSLGALAIHGHPSAYVTAYIVGIVLDSLLLFGVLVELAWSILRPIRASLPRSLPMVIGVLILALGAAIWPFVNFQTTLDLTWGYSTLTHIQQTFSVLRVLVFLALAGSSQLLSIGWRDRELQIATGLGFNSLVSLGITILRTHQSTYSQYRDWNQVVIGSYLCSLVYWMYSFAQVEEQRREFSPQMQTMLLAVAGAARSARIGMADVPPAKPRKQDKP